MAGLPPLPLTAMAAGHGGRAGAVVAPVRPTIPHETQVTILRRCPGRRRSMLAAEVRPEAGARYVRP